MSAPSIRFDRFTLDVRQSVLRREGRDVALRPKAVQLLAYLIEQRHRVVPKEELLAVLWPNGSGTESNLTVNVAAIRRVLGEAPREHRWIATVPTVGYRFVGEVNLHETGAHRRCAVVVTHGEADGESCHPDALSLAESIAAELDVLADCASFAPAITAADPVAVARRASADLLLWAHIHDAPQRLEIDADLQRLDPRGSLWNERCVVAKDELHSLPARLFRHVAPYLGDGCDPAAPLPSSRASTDERAFRDYLEGRHLFRSMEDLESAVELLRHAIERDPDFALAHAALAETQASMWWMGALPPSQVQSTMQHSCARALALDPLLPQAHRTAGIVHLMIGPDWARAREHLLTALQFAPFSSMSFDRWAIYLCARGEMDAAIDASERAVDLDPLALRIRGNQAAILFQARHFDEALSRVQRLVTERPDAFAGHLYRAWFTGAVGDPDAGVTTTRHFLERFPSPLALGLHGGALARAGHTAAARATLTEIAAQRRTGSFVPAGIDALVLAPLGETDAALEALCRGAEESWGFMIMLASEPRWDGLRSHPRYRELHERVYGHASAAADPLTGGTDGVDGPQMSA